MSSFLIHASPSFPPPALAHHYQLLQSHHNLPPVKVHSVSLVLTNINHPCYLSVTVACSTSSGLARPHLPPKHPLYHQGLLVRLFSSILHREIDASCSLCSCSSSCSSAWHWLMQETFSYVSWDSNASSLVFFCQASSYYPILSYSLHSSYSKPLDFSFIPIKLSVSSVIANVVDKSLRHSLLDSLRTQHHKDVTELPNWWKSTRIN